MITSAAQLILIDVTAADRAGLVLLFWGAGRLFGFQVSLVWSLVASIVLTVVANLVPRLFWR